MNKTQRKVLSVLQQNESVTPNELACISGYALSGVRRRLSDLREMGYIIEVEQVLTNKYFLRNKDHTVEPIKESVEPIEEVQNQPDPVEVELTPTAEKIIDWFTERNNFGRKINLDDIANALDISLDEVSDGMGKIYQKYKVLQLSNKLVLVQP